jgi:hypothetical protein
MRCFILLSAQRCLYVTGFPQGCAVPMLRSADLCNALYLRDACVSYIVGHFKAVVITEECVNTSCCAAHEKHCAVSVPCLSNLPICFASIPIIFSRRYSQLPSELMLSVQVRAAASSHVSGNVMTRFLAESSGRYTALK